MMNLPTSLLLSNIGENTHTGKPLVQRTAALSTLWSISVIFSDKLISNKLQKKLSTYLHYLWTKIQN